MNYEKINYLMKFMPKEVIDFCEEVRESNNEKELTIDLRKWSTSVKSLNDYVELFNCCTQLNGFFLRITYKPLYC